MGTPTWMTVAYVGAWCLLWGFALGHIGGSKRREKK